MVSILAKRYIIKKAKADNKKLPANYTKILNDFQLKSKYKLIFSKLFSSEPQKLNASASFYNCILITPEWGYQLLTSSDQIVNSAFLQTLGHEAAHKEKEFRAPLFSSKKNKTILWYYNRSTLWF